MKSKEHTHYNKRVTIIHKELNLMNDNKIEENSTYLLFTVMKDGQPQSSFLYKIPDSYLTDILLGAMHEKYCPFCPN